MLDKYRARWIGQMFAAAGVILSLSLVAYEMKLARDLAMADLYQQRTALNVTKARRAWIEGDGYREGFVKQVRMLVPELSSQVDQPSSQ